MEHWHQQLFPISLWHHSDITNGRNIDLLGGEFWQQQLLAGWGFWITNHFSVRITWVSLGVPRGLTLTVALQMDFSIDASRTCHVKPSWMLCKKYICHWAPILTGRWFPVISNLAFRFEKSVLPGGRGNYQFYLFVSTRNQTLATSISEIGFNHQNMSHPMREKS